jgi:hypothetical protein
MNRQKRNCLLFGAVVAVALMALAGWCVRIIVVDEFAIADSNVKNWPEGTVEKEQWLLEHPDTLEFKTAVAPSFVERYDSLNANNINSFIKEWKEWSNELGAYSADSSVNEAVRRVYAEYFEVYRDDSCMFCVLPGMIEVRVYSGTFDEYEFVHDGIYLSDEGWEYVMKASQRLVYVPSCGTYKGVLYMTSEIGDLLSQYIGEDGLEANDGRLAELRYHIPVEQGHWDGWHFCTMPQIFGIHLYDDGFVADLRTSCCSGEAVFLPYDKQMKEIMLSNWQE